MASILVWKKYRVETSAAITSHDGVSWQGHYKTFDLATGKLVEERQLNQLLDTEAEALHHAKYMAEYFIRQRGEI